MRKLADEIVELELIHRNSESSEEEISKAEKRIIQISNLLYAMPRGLEIMEQIDDIVQQKLSKIS